MSSDRPRFRRSRSPSEIGARVRVLAGLLCVCAGLLWLVRSQSGAPPDAAAERLVVEVRGAVPSPGFYALERPLRIHAALAAAGLAAEGYADADLPPGTRVVVADGRVALEPMDELLIVGLPIDVNAASARSLQVVPGIGPKRAEAIVLERERGGAFATVEALTRVPGVGPATVEELRPFLTASLPGRP